MSHASCITASPSRRPGGKDLTAKSPGKVKAGGKIKFNEF